MENLGAMADSRYTGFCEITDRDILELHCSPQAASWQSTGHNNTPLTGAEQDRLLLYFTTTFKGAPFKL